MKWLTPLLILIAGCQRSIPAEAPCGFFENDNQRVTWGLDTPINMYVDSSVPSSYIPTIQAAVDEWNQASEMVIGRQLLRLYPFPSGVSAPGTSEYNTIYYIPNGQWPINEPASEEAVTTFFYTGDIMIRNYIRIDGYYNWSIDDDWSTCGSTCFSLKTIMVHELGHVLGLAHTPVSDYTSIMNPLLGANQTRTLNSENVYSLGCGY